MSDFRIDQSLPGIADELLISFFEVVRPYLSDEMLADFRTACLIEDTEEMALSMARLVKRNTPWPLPAKFDIVARHIEACSARIAYLVVNEGIYSPTQMRCHQALRHSDALPSGSLLGCHNTGAI
ncbi:hypothetical protein SAMN05428964_103377 [Thalassospira xiamenensis]|uniref:Uncharacterized protein n=1 Tax=Thalassospira xiamenensis TaxID=220697 RepID=A0A285THA5_9PROT|nr:hypothetical protein SAMN05428964_103377 [Thalassospira xiamenensis]